METPGSNPNPKASALPEPPSGVQGVRSPLRPSPRQWRLLAIIAVAVLVLAWLYRQLDTQAIHAQAARINGPLVFILLTVLPLVGFPVSVLHAAAGVRFGLAWGFVLVAASIFLQLLAAHHIVRLAPDFFARRLNALRRRLPDAAHQPLTIFTMLLPGAPYAAQIYVLPLVGVPLDIYLAWSLPINIARSIVGIAFGEFSDRLTPWTIAAFVLYGITIMTLSAWSFQRLRKKLAVDPPPAEGDPTPPA